MTDLIRRLEPHLQELRKRLILIALGIIFCILLLFPFTNKIYELLAHPLMAYLPHNSKLIAISVITPFFIPIKLMILSAFLLSLPNTIFQFWQFMAPALYIKEKKIIIYNLFSVIILSIMGLLFCYLVVMPSFFQFIALFKSTRILMYTDIDEYLNFTLHLLTIFAIVFQTPMIVFWLVYFKFTNLSKLKSIRRYIFVLCFVVSAIISPPDALSQVLLALPLYFLYELGILLSSIFIRKI